MSKSYFTTKKLVTLAILSAIGTVLMFLEIPSPIAWLKIDISDVVVYLGAMIYGPVGALIVALIKSTIHYLIKGSFVGVPIDQFIALVASLSYAIPLYYFTKLIKSKKENRYFVKIVPLVISSLIMVIFMTTINYWLTDLYLRLMIVFDISKVGTVNHSDVLNIVQGDYIKFTLPNWIQNSSFLPKDIWFWFVVLTYIPFNLVKAIITSSVYFILSYRLNTLLKRFQLSNKEESLLIKINE